MIAKSDDPVASSKVSIMRENKITVILHGTIPRAELS